MVDGEDDDRVVAQVQAFELGAHAAEVPVDPGDGGEIGADDLTGFALGRTAANEQVGVARADGSFRKAGRDGRPRGEVRRKVELGGVVHVEEALRRGWRAV